MTQPEPDFASILEAIPEEDNADVTVQDVDSDIDELDGAGQQNYTNSRESTNPAYEEQSFIAPGFVAPVDERTPEEKIADLLKSMASCRRLLMTIMTQCMDITPVEEVNAAINAYKENEYTPFSAASICAQLELAGAIIRVTPEGEPYDEVDVEPKLVVVDGVEYLEPQEPPVVCWYTTEAAVAVLSANNPAERLQKLFEQDEKFLPAYKSILILCANNESVTAQRLTAALRNVPLLEEANLLPAHFVDKLEKCDALEWKKGWHITDAGREILQQIEDVEALCTELPAERELTEEELANLQYDPYDLIEE